MALARNLKPNRIPKIKGSKNSGNKNYKKIAIYVLIGVAIIFGIYGILNLSRLAPAEEEKQGVIFETGDQPLPEEVKIWIDADGGLNMRSEPSTKSEILKIIPDDTELVALELSDDWYKVDYDGKTGWVHKDYVRTYNENQETGITDGWKTYKSTSYAYSVQYPKDWVLLDYGANKAANLLGYVGFGVQLSDKLDPAKLPPVVIKVTGDTKDIVDAGYSKKTDVATSEAIISGAKGTKYVYTASTGVQMTSFVVAKGSKTYILEESGGYADELQAMVGRFRLS